jgi:hypothetical protein
MKPIFLALFLLLSAWSMHAQSIQYSSNTDTSQRPTITLEGYVDTYFAFDLNQPKDANRPYFVSQARQNEFNVNLAYLSLKYTSERVRASFIPGFGTYMNANYAAERLTLRNLLEANVGLRLSKAKNMWLDMGVIGSPYTNENAFSLDQINLSRSFAPEYVPYYLTGAKLTWPLGTRTTLYLYYLNGWQVIEDVNTPLSAGTQLEIKPSDRVTINWNTYIGNEQSANAPNYDMRYFTDVYAIWNATAALTLTSCAYIGWQERRNNSVSTYSPWWQINAAARYALTEKHSLSGRIEYFDDDESVFIAPITGVNGFNCSSLTAGYNLQVHQQAMFRVEARYFQSERDIFFNDRSEASNHAFVLMGGLTVRFR